MYAHLLPKTEEQPAVRLVDPQEPGSNGKICKIYQTHYIKLQDFDSKIYLMSVGQQSV